MVTQRRKIPTFEELLKRAKQPKVSDAVTEERDFPSLGFQPPPGFKAQGDGSLLSPRGITFKNIKVDNGKITDFDAFKGDRPVRLPSQRPAPLTSDVVTPSRPFPGLRPLAEEPLDRVTGAQPPPVQPLGLAEEPPIEPVSGRVTAGFPGAEQARRIEEQEKLNRDERLRQEAISRGETRYFNPERNASRPVTTSLAESQREVPLSRLPFISPEDEPLPEPRTGAGFALDILTGRKTTENPQGLDVVQFARQSPAAEAAIVAIPIIATLGAAGYEGIRVYGPRLARVLDTKFQVSVKVAINKIARASGVEITNAQRDALLRAYMVSAKKALMEELIKVKGANIPLKTAVKAIEDAAKRIPPEKIARDIIAALKSSPIPAQAASQASQSATQTTSNAFSLAITRLIPKGTQTGAMAFGGLPREVPTVQSVVAKIASNQALTPADRQLYASQSQEVEAALQAQVAPEVAPTVVPEVAPVSELPEELRELANNARNLTKEEFLLQYQSGLNEQNLTRRETAQKINAFLKRTLKITPDQFYDTFVAPSQPTPPTEVPLVAVEAPLTEALITDAERIVTQAEAVQPTNPQVQEMRRLVDEAKTLTGREQAGVLDRIDFLEDELRASGLIPTAVTPTEVPEVPTDTSIFTEAQPILIPERATPPLVGDVPAGTVFHGSRRGVLSQLSERFEESRVGNLFGEGLYLTSSPTIASSYAKGIAGVTNIKVKDGLKLLDMDKPLPADAKAKFLEFAQREEFSEAIELMQGNPTGAEIYNLIADEISDGFTTTAEAAEIFDSLILNLEEVGYRGLKYRGGLRIGKGGEQHDVQVLWSPKEDATIIGGVRLPPQPTPPAGVTLPVSEVSKLETRIPLDLIRKDEVTEIARLTREIQAEGIKEPIVIRIRDDGTQIVWDGIHRLIVAQDLGLENIPVTFIGDEGVSARRPPTKPRPPPKPTPKPTRAKISPVKKEVAPKEQVAKLAEQVKAKLEVEPPIVKPKPSVERRTEIQNLLKEPAKNLPKGTTKIELRKELAEINKSLIPQEKKLRSQIMATVKGKSIGVTQSRAIFRTVGGSRYLTNLDLTQLEKVLKAVEKARPIRIKGKIVITPKKEALIQSSKKDLMDQGILTEATYKDILESMKLSTDKYVDPQNFITNTQGSDIIRAMRNIAILNPLGELKFGKPTALKLLTSQTYYAQVLGVKPLTNPLELAKVDFDLAHRAMSVSIDNKLREVNKAWGVSAGEIIKAKAKNVPTKGSSALRDLLDKNEEAPANLTDEQKELFNWFRNLNRTIINGENEVRRAMGVEEISYRQAYVRHIPDAMASSIIEGVHPLPQSLIFWARKLVSKKIFNPMELHRQLSDDLAEVYSKDLAFATKSMVFTGLKEIHLAQPLRTFTEQMGALSDVMPASTRKWVTDYINQVIKGQQTEWDESVNALVTEGGIGKLIDRVLVPFNRTLGNRPVSKLASTIGTGTIYSVLAAPRPRLVRLMIRNMFQRTQELALHGVIPTLKSFLPDTKAIKDLKGESRYLKGYTGIEEWPTDLLGKLGKIPLAPYQFTATLNADRGMSTAYHDYIKFFENKKYKDLGWVSEKRTYKEEKGFLYPEEQKLMLEEMELATRATQYQYIGMGMPEIFRHKTLIPLTRLQSWWMNHFTMFHREAFHRFAMGETRGGQRLPWSSRVNWLKYLLFGGAILTAMGYGASFGVKVLPHNESPFMQFAIGLSKYVSAGSDWERTQAKRSMFYSWKAIVPGALAFSEFEKLWSGEMPLWQMFFYGSEETGAPPRIPDWSLPISTLERAEPRIEILMSMLGEFDQAELDDKLEKAEVAGASPARLSEIKAGDYLYDITSLRRDMGDVVRNLDEKDIAKLEPIARNYVEFKERDKEYGLLSDKEQEQYLERTPIYTTNRLFWGEITTIPDLHTARDVVALAEKYNIPLDMIPAFQLTDDGKERIPSNRDLWKSYFDYYDLPGTSYLNMTQGQVDDGLLPEKHRKEWETYNKLKTDTARGLYRRRHKTAAYSKWRTDFRRANRAFNQWLVDQEYNKPLPKRTTRR